MSRADAFVTEADEVVIDADDFAVQSERAGNGCPPPSSIAVGIACRASRGVSVTQGSRAVPHGGGDSDCGSDGGGGGVAPGNESCV